MKRVQVSRGTQQVDRNSGVGTKRVLGDQVASRSIKRIRAVIVFTCHQYAGASIGLDDIV